MATRSDHVAALGGPSIRARIATFNGKTLARPIRWSGILVWIVGAGLLGEAVAHLLAAPDWPFPTGLSPHGNWLLLAGMLVMRAGGGLVQATWTNRHE